MKTTDRQRERQKSYYQNRKASGLCMYCAEPAEAGHIRREIHREITKDYTAGMRDIRKVKGLCASCGKQPPKEPFVSCAECLDRRRAL